MRATGERGHDHQDLFRQLHPFSDIDLLFLRPEKFQKTTDLYIQDLISIFWGIGMEIGHSCRTVKECVQLAKEDMTIKTSMIETRFLIGDKGIYEKFNHSFDNNVLKKNVKAFLQSKLKEKYDRYGTEDGLVCAQEPNVKEGLGGVEEVIPHEIFGPGGVSFSEVT